MTKELMLYIILVLSPHWPKDVSPIMMTHYEMFKIASQCDFTITSGRRSEEHNKEVGGADESMHLVGYALDIVPLKTCNKTLEELVPIAKKHFNFVLKYKQHLHIDMRRAYEKTISNSSTR